MQEQLRLEVTDQSRQAPGRAASRLVCFRHLCLAFRFKANDGRDPRSPWRFWDRGRWPTNIVQGAFYAGDLRRHQSLSINGLVILDEPMERSGLLVSTSLRSGP